jgi:hypothetical protein
MVQIANLDQRSVQGIPDQVRNDDAQKSGMTECCKSGSGEILVLEPVFINGILKLQLTGSKIQDIFFNEGFSASCYIGG